MKKKDSERERLLRLIDGDEKAVRATKFGIPSWTPDAGLTKTLGFSGAGAHGLPRGGGRILSPAQGTTRVLQALFVLLALLIAYGLVDLLASLWVVRAPAVNAPAGLKLNLAVPSAPIEPVDRFVSAITSTNVFNPQRVNEVPAENPAETRISGALKLVGIDWDGEPVAMIEDIQSGKTYFAKENAKIEDVKVIKIQPDSVVISRGDIMEEIK